MSSVATPSGQNRPASSLVELSSASYTYRARATASVTAVNGADLAIPSGEHVAIVGPSGSGKSTLLGLMGLLIAPTSGRVAVAGRDTSALDDHERSRVRQKTIGFVFQQFHLLPHMDALSNVGAALVLRGMARSRQRERAAACLDRVGLADRQHHRPGQLSGGEQQRVAIARAIAAEPPLLLADEPSGNLDSSSRDQILELLAGLHGEGTTIVVVTHDREVAASANRRIHVEDGIVRDAE